MNQEVAKAINNVSKRLNEVEWKLDKYFSQQIKDAQSITGDAWESDKMYEPDDICIYNNTVYKCIVRNRGIVPTNTDFFEAKTMIEIIKETTEREEETV